MSGNVSASAILAERRDTGPIAGVDPRARLMATLIFLVTIAFVHDLKALAAALVTGFLAALLARLPMASTMRRLATVEGFLALLLVVLPVTVPGSEVFAMFGVSASWEGLERAFQIVARVNAGVLVIAALTSTMGTVTLAGAMVGIGVPVALAGIFQLAVRYIAVFHEEYTRLRCAMRARAFQPGSNRHSWRTLGHLIGMLVVRSVERAERVSRAMRCRGFQGRFPTVRHERLNASDVAFLAIWLLSALLLIVIERST
jgi:cobalt/nickel transport system permease protein